MSQPPFDPMLSYQPMPQLPKQLKAVQAISIIGIVFGAMGTLCLSFGTMFQLLALLSPQIQQAIAKQGNAGGQPLQIAFGVSGLILSVVLLTGAIGCQRWKNWARTLLLWWAIADAIYDTAKLVLTFVVVLPRMNNNPALANNPAGPGVVNAAKIGGAVFGVIIWLVLVGYALAVWVYFKQTEVEAAFASGGNSPA